MNMEKTLRNTIYGGLALLLVVPMVVTSSMYFPYITGKNFLFRIIVLVIGFLWVALVIKNKRYSPRKSGILYAFGGWVFVMLIANVFGENPIKAFWSNYERMEGWVTIVLLLLLFVVITSVMRGAKAWTRFFNASLVVSSFIALAAVIDFLKSGARADVYLGNAAYLGGYLLIHSFIALWFLWRWYEKREKTSPIYAQGLFWLYLCLFALNAIGVYSTETRGSLLGLLGGLGLSALIISILGKRRPYVRKATTGVLVALVVIVGGFLIVQNTSFVQNNSTLKRFADISFEEDTTKTRLIVWESALKGFSDRPIFGWGQEGFSFVYNKYYNPEMYAAEPWYDRTHNVVLDWLIAGGILGFLGYLSLYFFALRYIWKDEETEIVEKSILTGLIGAYFIHNLFVFDNITSYLLFTYLLAYLHVRHTKEKEIVEGPLVESKALRTTLASGAVVVGLVLAYVVNVPSIIRADSLLDALRYMNQARQTQEGVPEALDSFERALDARAPVGAQEVREQFVQNAHYISVMGAVPEEVRSEFSTKAVEAMMDQVKETPNDARILVFLGSLYNQYGQHELAFEFLEEALQASPGKQDILMQINRVYLAQGEYEKAREIMEETYSSAPKNRQAVKAYAATLIYTGDIEEAETLLETFIAENSSNEAAEEQLTLDIYSDPDLIKAYISMEEYEKAIALLHNRVQLQKNNIQNWVSLAAAYYQSGQISKAIETLEDAQVQFPQAEMQIKGIIGDIRSGELTF